MDTYCEAYNKRMTANCVWSRMVPGMRALPTVISGSMSYIMHHYLRSHNGYISTLTYIYGYNFIYTRNYSNSP